MEFGQIPKQVFTLPHPKRLVNAINLLADLSLSRSVLMSGKKILITENVELQMP